VAELLEVDGITLPNPASQSYGAIAVGGTATRNFGFTVDGAYPCGGTITATFDLYDGATYLGQAAFDLDLGVATGGPTAILNPNAVTFAASSGTATPYPSTIDVVGVTGPVTGVTVNLYDMNHTYPDDLDILLVGPLGQTVMLMSDCGAGIDIVNVNLTFDDAAAGTLPDSAGIVSGTYQPTNYGTETMPPPAPADPYGSLLSSFNGLDPNGTWSLYVNDDIGGDTGNINGGWELNLIMPFTYDCCLPADLQVTKVADSAAAAVGQTLTYTIEVYNAGPAAATNVVVTDTLPPEVAYVSCATTLGTCDAAGDPVIVVNIPVMNPGETAVVTIVADVVAPGDAVNTATALADNNDPNPADNTAGTTTAAAAFTHNFVDDYGRGYACVNEFSGEWEWNALDPRVGWFVFGGPGMVRWQSGIMVVNSLQGIPFSMNLKYNSLYNTAYGYAQFLAYRIKSGLYDRNTLDDPLFCDVP